jgi:hypothetical protein
MAKSLSRLVSKPRASEPDFARRGSVAVEFALLSPLFFLMLLATVEFCLMFGAQQLLESATFNASRLGKTGYVEVGKTQQETVNQVLFNELSSYGSFFDVARLVMTAETFSTFSGAVAGGGGSGLGSAEEIVVYHIAYPWEIFTPIVCDALPGCYETTSGSFVNLKTSIVVRNEPYGGS